jgi:hypothetical protein
LVLSGKESLVAVGSRAAIRENVWLPGGEELNPSRQVPFCPGEDYWVAPLFVDCSVWLGDVDEG